MNNVAWVDACATAELVRSGTASPKELVDGAIERIERINPQLNAVIHERFDKARAEAAGNLPDGPLRGVPMLLKDECPSAGDPYTCGAEFLKGSGYVADAIRPRAYNPSLIKGAAALPTLRSGRELADD